MSLGKRSLKTNACNIVDTRSAITVNVEIRANATHNDLVTIFGTWFEYLIVAIAAPVIGKV